MARGRVVAMNDIHNIIAKKEKERLMDGVKTIHPVDDILFGEQNLMGKYLERKKIEYENRMSSWDEEKEEYLLNEDNPNYKPKMRDDYGRPVKDQYAAIGGKPNEDYRNYDPDESNKVYDTNLEDEDELDEVPEGDYIPRQDQIVMLDDLI